MKPNSNRTKERTKREIQELIDDLIDDVGGVENFARRTGMNRGSAWVFAKGGKLPRIDTLAAVAEKLGRQIIIILA